MQPDFYPIEEEEKKITPQFLSDLLGKSELLNRSILNYPYIKGGTITGGIITGGIIRTNFSGNRIEITATDREIKYYDNDNKLRGEIGGEGGVTIGIYNEVPTLCLRIGAIGDEAYLNATTHLRLSSGISGTDKRMIWDFDNIRTATSGKPDMGLSTAPLGYLHTIGLNCWGNALPNTNPIYSSLGESTRYWQYLWAYYVRYKNLSSFQDHDDIKIIKNIKEKTITRDIVIGYDETKKPRKPIIKKETIKVWDMDSMPEGIKDRGFYDAGAVNGLMIGTLKQLIKKVEDLEEKIIKLAKIQGVLEYLEEKEQK